MLYGVFHPSMFILQKGFENMLRASTARADFYEDQLRQNEHHFDPIIPSMHLRTRASTKTPEIPESVDHTVTEALRTLLDDESSFVPTKSGGMCQMSQVRNKCYKVL